MYCSSKTNKIQKIGCEHYFFFNLFLLMFRELVQIIDSQCFGFEIGYWSLGVSLWSLVLEHIGKLNLVTSNNSL